MLSKQLYKGAEAAGNSAWGGPPDMEQRPFSKANPAYPAGWTIGLRRLSVGRSSS